MKKLLMLAAGCAASGLWAVPHVDQDAVLFRQDNTSRKVTIQYTLRDETAIVTVDIQTNATGTAAGPWVSIGSENLNGFEGAVNRVVEPGTYEVRWNPSTWWPDHKIAGTNTRAVVTARSPVNPPDYMAVNLLAPYDVAYYEDADQVPGGVTNTLYKTTKLLMRRMHVMGKTWRMGSKNPNGIDNAGLREAAVPHYVHLTEDYYIGVYEFTQKQFHLSMDPNRSFGDGTYGEAHDCRPAHRMSWVELRGAMDVYNYTLRGHEVDPASLIAAFRTHHHDVGVFDLPTDAQWEYAARSDHADWTHSFQDAPEGYASQTITLQPVGTYKPTDFGLYDVQGNVSEWTLDLFSSGDAFAKADGTVYVDPHGGGYVSGGGPVLRDLWNQASPTVQRNELGIRDVYNGTATNRGYYGFRLACNFMRRLPSANP